MNNTAKILLTLTLCMVVGCSSPPDSAPWRTVTEDKFTFEAPVWLRDKSFQGVDSNAGSFVSRWMRVEFDEVDSMLYPPEKSKTRHQELLSELKGKIQNESSPRYVKKLGGRYALFKVARVNQQVSRKRQEAFSVRAFIPYVEGGYLSLTISYDDEALSATAFRIANSISFSEQDEG